MVHPGCDAQARIPGLMDQHRRIAVCHSEIRDKWPMQRRCQPWIVARWSHLLVRKEIGLHDQFQPGIQGFDLVADRGHGALSKRDQPLGTDAHAPSGLGGPHGVAAHSSATEVQDLLVLDHLAVAHIHRRFFDEQLDGLAVGHVDDGLTVLGIAISTFGIWQFVMLVHPVEIRARCAYRFPLVEVAPQAEVTVRQGEDRFDLR